jgi:hypothetical protein
LLQIKDRLQDGRERDGFVLHCGMRMDGTKRLAIVSFFGGDYSIVFRTTNRKSKTGCWFRRPGRILRPERVTLATENETTNPSHTLSFFGHEPTVQPLLSSAVVYLLALHMKGTATLSEPFWQFEMVSLLWFCCIPMEYLPPSTSWSFLLVLN